MKQNIIITAAAAALVAFSCTNLDVPVKSLYTEYPTTDVALEAKMADIEKILAAPTPDADIMELTRNYLELKRDLDAKMDEWASL